MDKKESNTGNQNLWRRDVKQGTKQITEVNFPQIRNNVKLCIKKAHYVAGNIDLE